jgi:hypothetical protein
VPRSRLLPLADRRHNAWRSPLRHPAPTEPDTHWQRRLKSLEPRKLKTKKRAKINFAKKQGKEKINHY